MAKYIDADKLKKQITELIAIAKSKDWPIAAHLERVNELIDSLQQEQPEVIGGVVHHALGNHWVVVNQKQLCARLKQFSEGEEVGILVNARKEE